MRTDCNEVEQSQVLGDKAPLLAAIGVDSPQRCLVLATT
jgi:hypothetical protein